MSNADGASLLPAETRARAYIDQQLTQAGWKVQNKEDLNLFAGHCCRRSEGSRGGVKWRRVQADGDAGVPRHSREQINVVFTGEQIDVSAAVSVRD
jgi:hypothetical protein